MVLASGSSGNCLLVEAGGSRVLVDAGLSARRLGQRLGELGVDPAALDGVLVSHEHSDHARGLRRFCGRHGVPVFCNLQTADALGRGDAQVRLDWRLFQSGRDFEVGRLAVECFAVPHDASEPLGFALHFDGVSLGVLTDLGFASQAVLERVAGVDALLVEANHDMRLLQDDSRRPWAVKQRISSRHGHLSNDAAAEVVAHCAERNLKRVVLGHLSRDCNRAELARQAVASRLQGGGIEVDVVEQDDAVLEFRVGRAQPPPGAAGRVMETPLLAGWDGGGGSSGRSVTI